MPVTRTRTSARSREPRAANGQATSTDSSPTTVTTSPPRRSSSQLAARQPAGADSTIQLRRGADSPMPSGVTVVLEADGADGDGHDDPQEAGWRWVSGRSGCGG